MSAEITEVIVNAGDITVLQAAPATINTLNLNYSNTTPQNIGRVGSAGTAVTASRSDHVHSAADLLVDGGNY